MIIVEPVASLALTPITNPTNVANLNTEDPREIYEFGPSGALAQISVNLGQDRDVDTIALINTNGTAAATWTVSSATTAQGGDSSSAWFVGASVRAASDDAGNFDANGPAGYVRPAIITARALRIQVTQPAGAANFSAGRLIIGKSWKPQYGREQGSGRVPLDTGTRQRLADGGLALVPGSLVSGFQWVFGDLDDSESARLWGLYRRNRTTEPLLLIEEEAAISAEGIHYGTFINLEQQERSYTSKNRQVMRFEDWL